MSTIMRKVTDAEGRELTHALLQELRYLNKTTTDAASRYFGRAINRVLLVETAEVPATAGHITRSLPATIGMLRIRNHSKLTPVTVVVGGPTGAAPAVGVGVYVVPPGTVESINLGSTTFTVYSNSLAGADYVSFQAFADGGRP